MTMDRANPFADLTEFQSKPKPKPVQCEAIEKLAQENGFPSWQSGMNQILKEKSPVEAKPRKKSRRYTTVRNQQINIKATSETIEKLYRIADDKQLPLGNVLKIALDSLSTSK